MFRIYQDEVLDDATWKTSKTEHVFVTMQEAINKIHELEEDVYGIWFYIEEE